MAAAEEWGGRNRQRGRCIGEGPGEGRLESEAAIGAEAGNGAEVEADGTGKGGRGIRRTRMCTSGLGEVREVDAMTTRQVKPLCHLPRPVATRIVWSEVVSS